MGKYDDKTEKPTDRRRREARREGTVARSAEVSTAVALLVGVLTLRVLGGNALTVAAAETRSLLGTPLLDTTGVPLARVGDSVTRMVIALAGPMLAAMFAAALVSGFAQVGFHVAPKAAKPSLKKLSPKRGLEKFKPSAAGWELTRTLLKVGALGAVVWGPLTAWIQSPPGARSADEALSHLLDQIWVVLLRAMLLAAVIGAADYAYNRWRTTKQIKMSKQDVKQEHKDSEGDPQVKAQRRRRAQDMSRNRMLHDVGTADVVVVNPTHFAVALRYGAEDAAPRVVAKGTDRVAARIRREARRTGVPLTEDKPLARALYRTVKLGQYVPGALFEAVAVVLALAYRRTGRAPAGFSETTA